MKKNVNRNRIISIILAIAFILGIALFFTPITIASPTIVEPSTATTFVTSADLFFFACGIEASVGATWTLIAPNGAQMSITKDSTSTCTSPFETGVRLDGFIFSESAFWTSTGSLIGAPSDGTWRIENSGSSVYASDSHIPTTGVNVGNSRNVILQLGGTLASGGKSIVFGMAANNPSTTIQYWNTVTTLSGFGYRESSTASQVGTQPPITPSTIDPPDEDPQESPVNFKFFQTTTGLANPLSATGQSAIVCPASVSLTGTWKRGATQSANTFIRFAYIPYIMAAPVGDLRLNNLVQFTALTDQGAGATGSVTHTGAIYGNPTGNTYQLLTRSSSTGVETVGNPVYVAPLQCVITGPAIAITDTHAADTFDVTVSHSQCNGDPVSFATDIQIGNVLTVVSSLTIFIQRDSDGLTVAAITNFRSVGNKVDYAELLLPPGAYVALGKLVLTGVAAGVLYDSQAFNVPIGTCGDTTVPIGVILNAINNTNASVEHIDNTLDNVQSTQNTTLVNIEHIDSTLDNVQSTQNSTLVVINGQTIILNHLDDTLDNVQGTQNTTISLITTFHNNLTAFLGHIDNEEHNIHGAVNSTLINIEHIDSSIDNVQSTQNTTLANIEHLDNTLDNVQSTQNNTNVLITNNHNNETSFLQHLNQHLHNIEFSLSHLNTTIIGNFTINNNTLNEIKQEIHDLASLSVEPYPLLLIAIAFFAVMGETKKDILYWVMCLILSIVLIFIRPSTSKVPVEFFIGWLFIILWQTISLFRENRGILGRSPDDE